MCLVASVLNLIKIRSFDPLPYIATKGADQRILIRLLQCCDAPVGRADRIFYNCWIKDQIIKIKKVKIMLGEK